MRVAACQMNAKQDKKANLAVAIELLERAAQAGADLAVLPEYLDYLGTDEGGITVAETVPGPVSDSFVAAARRLGMWVLAGSIHTRREADGRCCNTSLLVNRQGRIVARYDKLHLFDIGLAGQPTYRESAAVSGGSDLVTAEIDGVVAGLSICYDLRFPEVYRLHALAGAQLLLVPAAFTLHTGRDHWELLLRARAVENQCFVVGAAQVGESIPGRSCYGRSMIVDPWGTILACAPDTVGVIVANLDFERQHRLRSELPALANRRPDVYRLEKQ